MQIISRETGAMSLLSFEIKKSKERIDFPFQEVGIAMQKVYGKKVWPLFYREPLWKIQEAFKICTKKGTDSFPYLCGVIKNLK